MADFTLISRSPALTILTLVAETSTITNNSGSVITAGNIVDVVEGDKTTRRLDVDSMVEVKPGEVGTVTAIAGAVGIGMYNRSNQLASTGADVVDVTAVTKAKTKNKIKSEVRE